MDSDNTITRYYCEYQALLPEVSMQCCYTDRIWLQ